MLHSRATPDEAQAFNAEIRAGSMGVEWWPKLDVQAADFRAVEPLSGGSFELLPADA